MFLIKKRLFQSLFLLVLCSFALALPTQHQAALNWTQSTSIITSNCVYRSQVSGGPYTQLNCSSSPSTSYTDLTVSGGQTYYYVITAVAGTQESAFSNEVKTVIPQSPNPPQGLTAVAQ